jgi:riboflavin biosynthesis pyrimidine reductase
MYVYTDFPFGSPIDANNLDDAIAWWESPHESWVRANVVTDARGNTIDSNGTSSALTGGADRALLTALRESADVVVIGGATIRAEPHAVPRNRPVVVVSRTANIPADAIARAASGMTVLHHRSTALPNGVVGVALARFTGTAIVAALNKLGHHKIVVEGGATLLRTMLESNSITEWCQTLSPHAVGKESVGGTLDVSGVVSFTAHDTAGFRYTRRTLNGAPVASAE